jgi:LysM repeat protein
VKESVKILATLPLLLFTVSCAPVDPASLVEPTTTLISFANRPDATPTISKIIAETLPPSGPTATPFVHIVQQGETLLGIAIRYGVSLDDLLLVNPDVDPRILSVGRNISIPGPSGEPIDLLLPTPTAMPLTLGNVYCYPMIGDSTRCLVKISNMLGSDVEGISANISLFDSEGVLLDHTQASSMTRVLPLGKATVLDATFRLESGQTIRPHAELVSAVQVSNLGNRQIPVDISNLKVDRSFDKQLYHFEGLIEFEETESIDAVILTVQVFGYNNVAEPNGFNAVQFEVASTADPVPFELSLFSLGGEIADFEILLEAQLLSAFE